MTDTRPVFSSDLFDWVKGSGCTTVGRLGLRDFPREGFRVRSARTNETRLFRADNERMVTNEFYDGEGYDFISGDSVRIHIWA